MTDVATRPPPTVSTSPAVWVKERLFPNAVSGVMTVILVPILIYVTYRAFLFVAVNAQWEAVSRNLTLFMQGTFPRDQQLRLVVQLVLVALSFGIGVGTASAAAGDRAREAGLPVVPFNPLGWVKRFWSVIIFVAILLYFASTTTPVLVVGAAVVAFAVGTLARLFPPSLRTFGWVLAGLALVAGFQAVSGTTGRAWVVTAILVATGALSLTPLDSLRPGLTRLATGTGVVVLSTVATFALYWWLIVPGIGWDRWSGLHLTLWVAAISIVLSFPVGLLLALARRSSLPALRTIATGYIELIRGVPLITLLFMGQFILPFLLPVGTILSDVSRAIAAFTLFTAAYVAEIVRGGLQSLPRGQFEAGQALGLPPATAMRKIILPQALRAVIPAMVGQFISLFKDTSLLLIIAIDDFLGVRGLIHAQRDFLTTAHAETLVFVAVGYWAFAYAMSKESQRLEQRLRVGDR